MLSFMLHKMLTANRIKEINNLLSNFYAGLCQIHYTIKILSLIKPKNDIRSSATLYSASK